MSNSTVWAAYKLKMKEGNNSIVNRRVSKRLERRHRRDEEINKRRNLSNDIEGESIPENGRLPEVIQISVKPAGAAGKQAKVNDRVERLRKWQEEKKKKAHQESKKPLFKVAGFQRGSEAILFQKENQQISASKPVTSVYKFTASAPKDTSTKKTVKYEGNHPHQDVKVVKDASSVKSKVSSERGLKKSKSSVVLGRQNPPPKPELKKETKASVKVADQKPLRKFKSSVTVNNAPKITKGFTDMSKKLTIAATSKRNAPEISPKRNFRKGKSSIVKEVLPNKVSISKPLKPSSSRPQVGPVAYDKNSEHTSSDSQDHLSDANVPSPRHSTPHVLKFSQKSKSSSRKAKTDDQKESRRKSSRKSSKKISPVQVAKESGLAQFFSDSDNDIVGLPISLSDKKEKTPARKRRNEVDRKTPANEKSSQRKKKTDEVPCTRRSIRKSVRLAMMEQREEQTVSNMEGVETAEGECQMIISIPIELNVEQKTPLRKRQGDSLRPKLQASARKLTRLMSLSNGESQVVSEMEISQSSCDTGNDVLDDVNKMLTGKKSARKSLSKNTPGALRKSTRKSSRFASTSLKECPMTSLETIQTSTEHGNQVFTSSKTEMEEEPSTPPCRRAGEDARRKLRKSGRKSNFTSVLIDDDFSSGDSNHPSSTDEEGKEAEIYNGISKRSISVSISDDRETPMLTGDGKINSSGVQSPLILSVPISAVGQENRGVILNSVVSSAGKDLIHSGRKSMKILTYEHDQSEAVDLVNNTNMPRKSLTPLTKSFSTLTCDAKIDNPIPMSVDEDSTPESDQRTKMHSALTKRKSTTPVLSNDLKDIKRTTPRSTGRSNLSDRRSTAKGRRSRRSTISASVVDEQVPTDEITQDKAYTRHSSSVPRRSNRSTVISVSDEGTAVGRNLELAVSYLVERQPVSAKASRILKELVVEKVEGESSFFEIPLDESFKSPKPGSSSNTPLASIGWCGDRQNGRNITPSQTNASPMTTPKSHRRGRSMAPSSTFKEPGLPLSAVRSQTASSRSRRKTEMSTPIRSPEEMIEILRKSPMIEMTRRKSRHCSTPVRPVNVNPSGFYDVSTYANKVNYSDNLPQNNETHETNNSSVEIDTVKDASQEKYFRDLILKETDHLNSLCCKWNDIVDNTPELSDDVLGQIRSVVGKALLLMEQRFKQFSGLVDNYAYGLGEKETNPSDLQGFWDMIYFQVEDVNNLFSDLNKLQSNGWQMKQPTPKVIMPKKKAATKAPGKKVKSNFAAFKNDLMKRKAATMASSSNSENLVEIIL